MALRLRDLWDFQISKKNIDHARDILHNEWEIMIQIERNSWYERRISEKDGTGLYTYIDYYIRKFALVNSNVIEYQSLHLTGENPYFLFRNTREWSLKKGFGTGSFGTGHFGTPRFFLL